MSGKPVPGVEPGTGSFNLILKNLSLYSYLKLSNKVSHPYKKQAQLLFYIS
jgi:hypothetical protein